MSVLPPAERPCGSCPYRRDVPSGVWATDEYLKLPQYDGETASQPIALFLCHRQDGRLCAGWTACHDMDESLSVRFALLTGRLDHADWRRVVDYKTTVELFSSGIEAAEHGLAEVERPGERAGLVIERLRAGQEA